MSEPVCSSCGLPITPEYGTSILLGRHTEAKCIELLKAAKEQAERERDAERETISAMLRALGRNAANVTEPVGVAKIVYQELSEARQETQIVGLALAESRAEVERLRKPNSELLGKLRSTQCCDPVIDGLIGAAITEIARLQSSAGDTARLDWLEAQFKSSGRDMTFEIRVVDGKISLWGWDKDSDLRAAIDAARAALDGQPCENRQVTSETCNCWEHAEPKQHTATEPHGEVHTDYWYECSWCGTKYTPEELDQLAKREQA